MRGSPGPYLRRWRRGSLWTPEAPDRQAPVGRIRPAGRAAGALAACLMCVVQVQAMWVRMSDADLIRSSQLIVVGEWIGQAPLHAAPDRATALVAVIAVHQVLKGPPATAVAFVTAGSAGRPVSGSDLRFERGDRGIWFLRALDPGDAEGLFAVDHPQRFLRDAPENAEAIAAIRRQLKAR